MLHEGWTAQVDDYGLGCEWLQDGKCLLIGDVAGGIYAFDGLTGRKVWNRKEIHQGGLLAMAVHPNGQSFATAGQDGCVQLWYSETGELITQLQFGKGWVEHLSWNHNGKLLAVAISRRVHVFNSKGEEQWTSSEQPSTISSIQWAETDELATSCYGRVTFFDPCNNKIIQELKWKGSLISMVLSPDGDIVACGSQDNSVHFWRRSTGNDAEMTGYPGKPSQLVFDQTGRFLATGGSEDITIWNFQGNGPEGTSPGRACLHPETISCLQFANNTSLLASGSKDGSVLVWYVDNNGDGNPVGGAFVGERVSAVCWRPDDSALAVTNSNGGIDVFRLQINL